LANPVSICEFNNQLKTTLDCLTNYILKTERKRKEYQEIKREESVFPTVLLLECGSVNMGLNLILEGDSVDENAQSALPGVHVIRRDTAGSQRLHQKATKVLK
jgi:hypothetical protein